MPLVPGTALVLLGGAILFVPAAAPADVTFSDTQFAATSWTHEIVYDSGNNLAFTIAYDPFGGNPDAHLRVTYGTPVGDGVPNPLDVAVGHFLVGALLHPATFPIESMDFSIDVDVLEGGVSGAVGVNLMLRQDGIVYFGPTFVALDLGGGTWMTADHVDLLESHFRSLEDLQSPPDFSSSGAPIEVGFITMAATSTNTGIEQDARLDNYAVTVRQATGTSVGALPAESAPRLLASPNPFTSVTTLRYDNPRNEPVRVDIFDVTGRRVRTLLDRHGASGPREISWNGTDDAGRPLPTATYFVRLHTGGTTETLRVLRIR